MRAVITVTGKKGSGKSLWLSQVKAALLATSPAALVEVTTYEGDGTNFSEQYDEFAVLPAQSGREDEPEHRETWSIKPVGYDRHHVMRGSTIVAGFHHYDDAHFFMRCMTGTADQRRAIDAVLERSSFYFDGDQTLFAGGFVSKNWKGGGGDFGEGAGVIPTLRLDANMRKVALNHQFGRLSAAEAPAIHDDLSMTASGIADVEDDGFVTVPSPAGRMRDLASFGTPSTCPETLVIGAPDFEETERPTFMYGDLEETATYSDEHLGRGPGRPVKPSAAGPEPVAQAAE